MENSPSAPVEYEEGGATIEDAEAVQGILLWSPTPPLLNQRDHLRRGCQTGQLSTGRSYEERQLRICGDFEQDSSGRQPPYVSVGELIFDGKTYTGVTLTASTTYNDPFQSRWAKPVMSARLNSS